MLTFDVAGAYWHKRAVDAEAKVKRLSDAIEWMCTEMPVNWEEIALAEGRNDVWIAVRDVIDPQQFDGPGGGADE